MADVKIRSRLYFLKYEKSLTQLFSFKLLNVNRSFIVASVVFLLIIIGLPGYAYASPGVTRGTILYPLKRFAEKVELSLPRSAESKAAIYEKNAGRRLAEAEQLSVQTKETKENVLVDTVNEALDDKNKAAEILSGLPKYKRNLESINQIGKSRETQEALVIKVAQNVGLEADEEVLSAVSKVINMVRNEDVKMPGEKETTDRSENETKNKTVFEQDQEVIKENSKDQSERSVSTTKKFFVRENIRKATSSKMIKFPKEIEIEKKGIEDLMKILKQDNVSDKEVESLQIKLDKKIENANQALDRGDFDKAGELIDDSHSLMKNVKFFLKPKKIRHEEIKSVQDGSDKVINIRKEQNDEKIGTSTQMVKDDKERSTTTDGQKVKLLKPVNKR